MALSINTIYPFIFKLWREKRFKLFLKIIKPQADESILDVGGRPSTWISHPQPVTRITCINLNEADLKSGEHPQHRIETVLGDGCALREGNQTYPIVFSNSVIEHVGDFAKQRQFAEEVRRVGSRLWVQTPAFECPLEPHFMLPFVHWLPVTPRSFIVRWISPWAWLERPSVEKVRETIAHTQLLTKRQMRELFPDCEIMTEKMLWFIPKSYIAFRTSVSTDTTQPAPVAEKTHQAELLPH